MHTYVQLYPSGNIASRHHVAKNNKARTPSKLPTLFSRPAAYFNPRIIYIYVRILYIYYTLFSRHSPVFPEWSQNYAKGAYIVCIFAPTLR